MDRNRYYGAECASLKLEQLYEKFGTEAEKKAAEEGKLDVPAALGRGRYVDQTQKAFLSNLGGGYLSGILSVECEPDVTADDMDFFLGLPSTSHTTN